MAKPDNPAISPHALEKTCTRHTDIHWKAEGGDGREQKPLNALHMKFLPPATCHIGKKVLPPKASGIPRMRKYPKITDNDWP